MATLDDRPRFAGHVKLSEDRRRNRWILQAPERVLVLDDVALEILRRCDGRSIAEIVADLGASFEAEEGEIARDVLLLIEDLRLRGVLA